MPHLRLAGMAIGASGDNIGNAMRCEPRIDVARRAIDVVESMLEMMWRLDAR